MEFLNICMLNKGAIVTKYTRQEFDVKKIYFNGIIDQNVMFELWIYEEVL